MIVDEAYSDFSRQQTMRSCLLKYPNLIVLNTMSKAWASAAIRLGMAFASEEIIAIFRADDPDVIRVGAATLRWQFFTFPLGAIVMYSNMMMQTIRKPVRATILSSARQGLFFIPCILILPPLMGLNGVIVCQAVADLLSFLLAIPLVWSVLLELNKEERLYQSL